MGASFFALLYHVGLRIVFRVVSLMLPMWGMENLGLLCSRCYARYFDREGASVEVLLWVGWSAQFHGWGMLLGVSVSVSVVS